VRDSGRKENQVQDTIEAGNILIKEGTLLPEAVRFESEPCVPGWRLVKGFDGYGLDREIRQTGWTFFCLAGEIKATVFGIDKQKMVRRAIERILAGPKSEQFNSLGITRVAFVGSERFPLVRYVTVFARARHIQESLFLCQAKGLPALKRKSEHPSPSQSARIASGTPPFSQEPTKQSVVVSTVSQ
jgi:hypothetical protein